ncbi:hypothetical protein B0H13DRAFT_2332378 [Mycena leptocephala]|nr:hypothetical protein B0H13DRAFT_2332378 [Mycena leptocephala]
MSWTSLNEFWVFYSAPDGFGNVKRPEAERKEENEQLADLAHAELTPEQLTYRKGGDRFVTTKPAKIAALYRKLKGFEVEDEHADDNEDEDEDQFRTPISIHCLIQ